MQIINLIFSSPEYNFEVSFSEDIETCLLSIIFVRVKPQPLGHVEPNLAQNILKLKEGLKTLRVK